MNYGQIAQYKSISNFNNKAKTTLYQGLDGSLWFQQLFYIDNADLQNHLDSGYLMVRKFKDKALVRKEIIFKGETFCFFLDEILKKGIIKIN